jgi:hypothetical protein
MNTKYEDIVASYGLSADETSAVLGLIYAYREGRVRVENIPAEAAGKLTNAIICRGTTMSDFDVRLERVLVYFRKFNRENPK